MPAKRFLVVGLSSVVLAACAQVPSAGAVLRVELTEVPPTSGPPETVTIYVGREPIKSSELSQKARGTLLTTYPAEFLYGGKLANTCFVGSSNRGFSIIRWRGSTLQGPLWRVADAGWNVTLKLNPDGTAQGRSTRYFANDNSSVVSGLRGTYAFVGSYSECLEKAGE